MISQEEEKKQLFYLFEYILLLICILCFCLSMIFMQNL